MSKTENVFSINIQSTYYVLPYANVFLFGFSLLFVNGFLFWTAQQLKISLGETFIKRHSRYTILLVSVLLLGILLIDLTMVKHTADSVDYSVLNLPFVFILMLIIVMLQIVLLYVFIEKSFKRFFKN